MGQKEIENIGDLLNDTSFVKWVKFPDRENDKNWELWLKKNRQRQSDVALARELILSMKFKTKYPTEEEVEKAFDKVLMNVELKPGSSNSNGNSQKRVRISGITYYAKIAAVILLLLSSFAAVYWMYQNNLSLKDQGTASASIIKRSNPSAIRSKIILPDGSRVWLNAESELTYPSEFGQTREIKLSGEAYFEVVKNIHKPFIVKTNLAKIKVLGTSFNVNAYGDSPGEYVSLVEGNVAVSLSDSDTSSLLLPGEQIIVNNETGISETMPFDSVEVVGWTQGWLTFKNSGKDEILNKLGRWYGVKIELLNEPSETWNVNGYFRDQPLDVVLDRLSFSKDIDYKINGKTVKIEFR